VTSAKEQQKEKKDKVVYENVSERAIKIQLKTNLPLLLAIIITCTILMFIIKILMPGHRRGANDDRAE
jgi:hypothetical protein